MDENALHQEHFLIAPGKAIPCTEEKQIECITVGRVNIIKMMM